MKLNDRQLSWLQRGIIEAKLNINDVREIQFARVVEADAVVLSELSLQAVQKQDICASHDCNTCICPQLIEVEKRVVAQLTPTPPVTEPKNFGAVVEAQYFGYNSEKYLKARFFNNGRDWILEGTLNNFAWSDLINPTIISEGVEG